MPFINIQMKAGRTIEQKRKIASEVTESIARIAKVAPEAVRIVFSEIEEDDYALGGILDIDKK